jgi:hypothetical protein
MYRFTDPFDGYFFWEALEKEKKRKATYKEGKMLCVVLYQDVKKQAIV